MESLLRELAARKCEQMTFNEDCKTYWTRVGNHLDEKDPWCLPCRAKRFLESEYKAEGLSNRINFLLRQYSMEDGMSHPVDAFIEGALHMKTLTPAGLMTILTEANFSSPYNASDLLHSISRLDLPLVGDKAADMIELGLASPSMAMRESAIRCIENWQTKELVALLDYKEPESWLDEYRARLLKNLSRGI